MAVEYKHWEFSSQEQQKFQDWMDRIKTGHTGTQDIRNQQINFTPLSKPLSECMVTVVSTGGIHLKSGQAYDVANPHGDWSFREIPTDTDISDLAITHTHYNHVEADRDINCMFPLDRLRELRDLGVIGGIAPKAYSIMGFVPDAVHLVEETAPELARRVRSEGADLVVMTCG